MTPGSAPNYVSGMTRVPPHLTQFARTLRREATPAERRLWRVLSSCQPRFTRQLVVGRFIIDIAHRRAKVAIELDGGQHADAATADGERTAVLEGLGWVVLRFWNNEVLVNTGGVAQPVLTVVAQRLGHETHPRPLPCRERRGTQ